MFYDPHSAQWKTGKKEMERIFDWVNDDSGGDLRTVRVLADGVYDPFV